MKSVQLALVTGASSGLGKAIAYLLSEKGIPLLLTARDAERLQQVKSELMPKVSVIMHVCDLAKQEERKNLIALIRQKIPDLLINCAGFGLYGPCLDHPSEESLAMIEVNVSALTEITLEAARALRAENKRGTILNVSSAAAFFAYPTFAVYAASKAFVNQFSQAVDTEMKPYGIRVLCACPGQIVTEFRQRASKGHPQQPDRRSMSAEFAAQEIWKQIESGKGVHVFDWRYHWMVALSRLFPKKLIQRLLARSIASRYEK